MMLMDGTSYGRVLWRKACIAMILSSLMEFVLAWLLAYPGLALRRAPRLLMSNCETAIAAARLVFIQDQGYTPCPGSYAARVAIS